MTLVNRLAFFTNTTGTGVITSAGPAVTGWLDISSVTPGTNLSYGINDGSNWEYGSGLCNGTTLTRGPSSSSNSNNPINLSGGSALVFSTPVPSDFSGGTGGVSLAGSNTWTGTNTFTKAVSVTGTAGMTVSGTLTVGALFSGGTANLVQASGTSGLGFYFGAGDPNSNSVTAGQGSLYVNTTATTTTTRLYVMTDKGNWASFTASG